MTHSKTTNFNEFGQRQFLCGSDNGMPACPFCLEVESPSYALQFLDVHWPFADRILYSNDLAIAIAGYGPQVEPYALVIPKRHLLSIAETNCIEREAILDCLDALRSLAVFSTGTLSIFEHGDCGGNQQHSCIEHCHLHVLDGGIPIINWFREERSTCRETFFNAESVWSMDKPYLLAGEYTGNRMVSGIIDSVGSDRSQFFRRLIARHLHQTEWNWRTGMNPNYMRELVSAAKSRNIIDHINSCEPGAMS